VSTKEYDRERERVDESKQDGYQDRSSVPAPSRCRQALAKRDNASNNRSTVLISEDRKPLTVLMGEDRKPLTVLISEDRKPLTVVTSGDRRKE
jgi:hypothetical protein